MLEVMSGGKCGIHIFHEKNEVKLRKAWITGLQINIKVHRTCPGRERDDYIRYNPDFDDEWKFSEHENSVLDEKR